MAMTRTTLIGIVAAVAVVGAGAFYVLTSGEKPLVQLVEEDSDNKVRFEMAGVNYRGWPDLSVSVNGEQIATMTLEQQVRAMYEFDVPNSLSPVETVTMRITNESFCQNLGTGACETRKIIVRGLYLNDHKVENPVASGEGNLASLLVKEAGDITWTVEGNLAVEATPVEGGG